jgi:hypothetical protein
LSSFGNLIRLHGEEGITLSSTADAKIRAAVWPG